MGNVGELESKKKATLKAENGEPIELQFNPSECNFSQEISYTSSKVGDIPSVQSLPDVASRAGNASPAPNPMSATKSIPVLQYTGNSQKNFNLDLIFDTSGGTITQGTFPLASNVKEKTDAIEKLVKLDPTLHRAPLVTFTWGDICFEGTITSVKTSFTLFTSDGMPIRAKMALSLVEKYTEKIPKESPDRTKTRVLSEDTSLWSLAKNEYGDINEWRRIAKANNIQNPFDVETGTILEVPAMIQEE